MKNTLCTPLILAGLACVLAGPVLAATADTHQAPNASSMNSDDNSGSAMPPGTHPSPPSGGTDSGAKPKNTTNTQPGPYSNDQLQNNKSEQTQKGPLGNGKAGSGGAVGAGSGAGGAGD